MLAIVRNKAAAKKIFHRVGTQGGIAIVEVDVTCENGVEKAVD
jgi:hypothetical protein